MLATFLALLILGGVALCLMKPEERAQLARVAGVTGARLLRAAIQRTPSDEPFDDFLRERTRWAVVTPLLVAVNTLTFVFMLFEPGAIDAHTLVGWGANFAPRTTNGEWWRLAAATFAHAGLLHLLATIAGLVPLGLILERAVGSVAFAIVYLAAGILASLASLWTTSALTVSAGASGAIFGIYGLLLASVAWGVVDRPTVSIPAIVLKRIAAAAAVFFSYNLLTDDLSTASELAGLMTGVVGGAVVAKGVVREKPPIYRAAWVTAGAMVIAVACAIPVRGIADVRPEIARVAEFEDRTAGAYDAAIARFRNRPVSLETLVELIDRTIVPELEATRARLRAVSGVPPEQMPLVTAAEEYFQLREQSWRRRAQGLLESNMGIVREAEQTERAALVALRRIRPVPVTSDAARP